MNELIRALVKQAEEYAEVRYDKFRETPMFNTCRDKKFAELIVQECINVCEPVLDEPYEDMSEFGKGLVEGQDVAVEKIKKHFGVEE